MKHLTIVLLTLCLLVSKSNAQETGIEKKLWGIQAGIYPLSVYNELKLTNSIALRSEVGLGFGWSGGSYSTQWALLPVFTIEPRYYYNLQSRANKNKQTKGNSGNYLSLSTGMQPDFGITSDNVKLYPSIYIIPMYGLRRNIGKHFNFEAAFGLGYSWTFKKYTLPNGSTQRNTESGTAVAIRLAVGYLF